MGVQQLLLGSGGGEIPTYMNDVFDITNYGSEGGMSLTEYGSVSTSNSSPPMSGTYYAVFDNSSDRLVSTVSKAFSFGEGDFSLEAYVYRVSDSYNYARIMHFGPYWSSNDSVGFNFDDGDHANKVTFASYRCASKGSVPANGRILVGATDVSSSTWYHCCVTRKNGVFRLFIDGKLDAINDSILYETTEADYSQEVCIANTVDRQVSEPFAGRIQGVRIIKGYVPSAYDTDATTVGSTVLFTPPTTAHPVSGTSNDSGCEGFVCCQSSNASDYGNSKRIINGIDLAKHGGMVWLKQRNGTGWHFIQDTVRGFSGSNSKLIYANRTNAETSSNALRCFNSDGFTLQSGDYNNSANTDVVAYTFRRAPGFFDIVKYTGNATGGTVHNISHNLQSTPQWMLVKNLESAEDWVVYAADSHAAIGSGGNAGQCALFLNRNYDGEASVNYWANTRPTSSVFTVGDSSLTNKNGEEHICYLFGGSGAGPDADLFGKNKDENVIKSGFYNGNDSSDIEITCGWEPGWIIIKSANDTNQYANWFMFDTMRGASNYNSDGQRYLAANENWNENSGNIIGAGSGNFITITPTGFKVKPGFRTISQGSPQRKYVYMAIRSPQPSISKAKTDPSLIFHISKGANQSYSVGQPAPFASDFTVQKRQSGSDSDWKASFRLQSTRYVRFNTTNAKNNDVYMEFDYGGYGGKNGGSTVGGAFSYAQTDYWAYHWRRNGGSFDTMTWQGNGVSGRAINHQLGSVPTMVWVKCLSHTDNWRVYHVGLNGGSSPQNYHLKLDTNAQEDANSAIWNNTAPTSTQLILGNNAAVNTNGRDYVGLVFGDSSGISKCGYYTGNSGTNIQTVGFRTRFLMVKRADGSGDWNQIQGFNTGQYTYSDLRMRLNTTDSQSNDDNWAAVDATRFDPGCSMNGEGGGIGNSIINSNGHKYIYYAHA